MLKIKLINEVGVTQHRQYSRLTLHHQHVLFVEVP